MPLLLAVLGVVALVAAALVLRSLGSGYRVARLLAAAPEVTIEEAIALAAGPQERFVRVHGRVSSDEEFPDENDRPLVFRRERLEVRRERSGAWETLQDERVAVPFGVELRSAFIGVDVDAIGDGLVVMSRESSGRASEVAERLPASVPVDASVRLRVDQVSAVEQASVAGVPRLADGQPWMTAGARRPLIVSTMEIPAAMRVLSGGHRGRVLGAVVLIALALGLFAIAVVWAVASVIADAR